MRWCVRTCVLVTLLSAFTIDILGAELTAKLNHPFFTMLRNVSLFHAVERFGALVIGLWVLPDFVLVAMLLTLAVSVFQSSGALELLSRALSAPASLLGLPEPIIPLTLLRPLSGSGALVVFQNILSQFGPDSQAGEIASVLIGSTETTFYTIALYCSAAGIKKSRYAAPASLCADLMGFVASAAAVRWLMG